jgi:hypothetical protein
VSTAILPDVLRVLRGKAIMSARDEPVAFEASQPPVMTPQLAAALARVFREVRNKLAQRRPGEAA